MAAKKLPDARHGIGRRRFLGAAGAGVALGVLAAGCPAIALGAVRRTIPLFHAHTGEYLAVEIAGGGRCSPADSIRIDEFMRDFRTGEVHPIDPRLLETLRLLQLVMGGTHAFEVISGYRSPVTNAALRSRSRSVARRSLHMYGMAIDVRMSGISTRELRNAAVRLGLGGVGYYPGSRFVHLDTGKVRRW